MSAKPLLAAALALLASSATAQPAFKLPAGAKPQAFAAACDGKDGWSDPAPPVKVFANVYHVGTCGIVSLLIASPQGHVLIDTGPADAAGQVLANIRSLGFQPADVKWIVTSHEHHDHVGGIAEVKRATGAQVAARNAAKGPLERGTTDWRDPQAGSIMGFTGAPVDRTLADGEHLVVGPTDLTLHATPGHSPGSTSWTWRACDGSTCRNIVYADSLTAVSADKYKFTAQQVYLDAFARTIGRVAGLPCDILITPHPGASKLHERLAGTQPLVNPNACLDYAIAAQKALEARVAQEKSAR